MLEVASSELSESGVSADKAKELAERISEQFCMRYGGRTYRVPELKSMHKRKRDDQIRRDAESMSPNEVAKKYQLSIACVYRIINAADDG